jgi:hypothetical protein
MPLVVAGRVRHRQMQPGEVHAVQREYIPGLVITNHDFCLNVTIARLNFLYYNFNSRFHSSPKDLRCPASRRCCRSDSRGSKC